MRGRTVFLQLARAGFGFAVAFLVALTVWSMVIQLPTQIDRDVLFGWNMLSILPPVGIATLYGLLGLSRIRLGSIGEWTLNFAFFPVFVGFVNGKEIYIWWKFYEACVSEWFWFGGIIRYRPCENIPGLVLRSETVTDPNF